MKNKIWITLLLILVSVSGFTQRHRRPHPRMGGRGMFFDEKMLEELGLAVETRAKIQNLFFEMKKSIIELQNEIRKKDRLLREELKKNKPDVIKMKKMVREIAEIRKKQKLESGLKRLELMLLLNPSQRRRFFEIIHERRKMFWHRMRRRHGRFGPGRRRGHMGPPPREGQEGE